MNAGPAVSILCSAYRTEAYLAATIDSVLAQTSDDWELVVVDNGMSDAIHEIVASYDDPRIVFRRQPNAGVDGGYAAAAAAARGRYLVTLASDDMLTPDACAVIIRILDGNPHVDALTGDAYVLDDGRGTMRPRSWQSLVGQRRPTLRHRVTLREVLGGYDLYSGAAFRRRAWDATGGFSAGGPSDLALWLRLLRTGHDVRVAPDKIGVYRLRAGSVSRSDQPERWVDELEAVCLAAIDGLDDPSLRRAVDRRIGFARHHVAMGLSRAALLSDDLPEARRQARIARGHRRTPRAVAVSAGLTLSPRLLRGMHPAKAWVTTALTRAAAGVTAVERRSRRTSAGRVSPARWPHGSA